MKLLKVKNAKPTFTVGKAALKVNPSKPTLNDRTSGLRAAPKVSGPAGPKVKGPA